MIKRERVVHCRERQRERDSGILKGGGVVRESGILKGNDGEKM